MGNSVPEHSTKGLSSRFRRRLAGLGFLLIWCVSALLALGLYFSQKAAFNIEGFAEVSVETCAGLEDARIEALEVQPGERVPAGVVVVRLDSSDVEREIAALWEMAQREEVQNYRLFTNTIQRMESDRRELSLRFEEYEAEHKALLGEIERLEALVEQRLAMPDILTRSRVRAATLEKSLIVLPTQIVELETELAAARKGLDDLRRAVGTDTGPFNAALTVLEGRRQERDIRTVSGGVVSEIYRREGDVVVAGEPILQIVKERSERILAFLPEAGLGTVASGQEVYISPGAPGNAPIEGRIVALVPKVDTLRDRASALPGGVYRGVTMIIEPVEAGAFTPGQKVEIRLRPEASLWQRLWSLLTP